MKEKLLTDIQSSETPIELPLGFLVSEVFKAVRISRWSSENGIHFKYNLEPNPAFNSDITVIFSKYAIS